MSVAMLEDFITPPFVMQVYKYLVHKEVLKWIYTENIVYEYEQNGYSDCLMHCFSYADTEEISSGASLWDVVNACKDEVLSTLDLQPYLKSLEQKIPIDHLVLDREIYERIETYIKHNYIKCMKAIRNV